MSFEVVNKSTMPNNSNLNKLRLLFLPGSGFNSIMRAAALKLCTLNDRNIFKYEF